MTTKPDLAALKQAAEEAETAYQTAALARNIASREAADKWKIAAAALTRYKAAERKVDLIQMRARAGIEAERGADDQP